MDFDGDGAKDLLVGTYSNRVVFFRNVATFSDFASGLLVASTFMS